jgi:hypothetical protein
VAAPLSPNLIILPTTVKYQQEVSLTHLVRKVDVQPATYVQVSGYPDLDSYYFLKNIIVVSSSTVFVSKKYNKIPSRPWTVWESRMDVSH